MIQQVIHGMHQTVTLKDLGELHFFLGVEVRKFVDGIYLSQGKYIADILAKNDMLKCSPVLTHMSTSHYLTKNSGVDIENVSKYRSIIGALQYVTLTRP